MSENLDELGARYGPGRMLWEVLLLEDALQVGRQETDREAVFVFITQDSRCAAGQAPQYCVAASSSGGSWSLVSYETECRPP